MPKQKWQKQTKRIKLRNLRCSEEEDDEDVPFHTKDVTCHRPPQAPKYSTPIAPRTSQATTKYSTVLGYIP